MRELDYGFILGKIKVLENKLIRFSLYERLASSNSLDEFITVLDETPYSNFETDDFHKMMDYSEIEDNYIFEKYLPERWCFEFLYIRNDFQNLRILLKATLSERALPEIKKRGNFSREEIVEVVSGEKKENGFLYEVMNKAVKAYYGKESKRKDVVAMESEIDKGMYKYLLNNFPLSEFLKEYLKTEIDLFNISNILRFTVVDKVPLSEDFLIEGGNLKIDFLKNIAVLPVDEITSALKITHYSYILEQTNEQIKEGNFLFFVKMVKNHLITLLKKTTYMGPSFEPVYRYFVLKNKERENLKRIFMGIKNNLDREKIIQGVVNVI